MPIQPLIALVLIVGCHSLVEAQCNIVGDKVSGDCSGANINTDSDSVELKVISSSRTISRISGPIRVAAGGKLTLIGISNGNVTVEKSGRADISGMVNGSIIVKGGSVSVSGTANSVILEGGSAIVRGAVSYLSGPVKVVKGAMIGGVPAQTTRIHGSSLGQ